MKVSNRNVKEWDGVAYNSQTKQFDSIEKSDGEKKGECKLPCSEDPDAENCCEVSEVVTSHRNDHSHRVEYSRKCCRDTGHRTPDCTPEGVAAAYDDVSKTCQ